MLKTISGLSPCSSGGGSGGTANDISGGAAGNVLYQIAASDTGFTNSAPGVLQSNGSTPSFSVLNLGGPYVTGSVSSTSNIAGGSAGKVVFQTGSGVTNFTNATNGVLQSNGTTPSFSLLDLGGTNVTGVPALASICTGLLGSSAGRIPYQAAPSTTVFTNAADGVLQSNGTTPSFSALDLSGTRVSGILPLTRGGTGSSTLTGVTGSGNIVASTSPTLTTPNIGAATGTSLDVGDTSMDNSGFLVGKNSSMVAYKAVTTDKTQYNLFEFVSLDGGSEQFWVGRGNATTPASGSGVAGRGLLWTSGAYPIDIIANEQAGITVKTDGLLKFYKYLSAPYLETDSVGNVIAGNSPRFKASLTFSQTITANILTSVNIATLDFDTTSAFNTTTHRYVPQKAGFYQCSATLGPAFPTVAGAVEVSLWKGPTLATIAIQGTHSNSASDFDVHQNCSGLIYLNGTTDYVEMFVKASVTQTLPASGSYFSATYIP